jgi:hypothetical protein
MGARTYEIRLVVKVMDGEALRRAAEEAAMRSPWGDDEAQPLEKYQKERAEDADPIGSDIHTVAWEF